MDAAHWETYRTCPAARESRSSLLLPRTLQGLCGLLECRHCGAAGPWIARQVAECCAQDELVVKGQRLWQLIQRPPLLEQGEGVANRVRRCVG